jgi:hypothetical protein
MRTALLIICALLFLPVQAMAVPAIIIDTFKEYDADPFFESDVQAGVDFFVGEYAYTLVRSEFRNGADAPYIPSSWDSEHLISITAGKKLKVTNNRIAPKTSFEMRTHLNFSILILV